MKRAVSALWARRAVRQAYFYTTTATTSSSPPEFGASASEAWDGHFRLHKPRAQHLLTNPRGQHLLTNPRVLDAIARHTAINPGDVVLEVGPGTGNLTACLLASHAARVTAVEIDPRMLSASRTSSRPARPPATRSPLTRQNVSEEKLSD
jgi:18S rRNA (adenine1779-N6/adenine1780-N6)-dimethyltransferase